MASTRLIRNLTSLEAQPIAASVVTIGFFDGLHLGHQQLLHKLTQQATLSDLYSVVITFTRPTYWLFDKSNRSQLMSWREKVEALRKLGIDSILYLPFNRHLWKIPAEDFVSKILVTLLGMKALIIGDDFRFGHNREGNYQLLKEMGALYNYRVHEIETLSIESERVSSSRIRQLLAAGEVAKANQLLGRPYSIEGKVIRGEKLGRQLGFPTANIALKNREPPLFGVFLVRSEYAGNSFWGVANLGIRPVVNTLDSPLLEVHLLDFSGSLYGERMRVYFYSRLRQEQAFDTIDLLKQAIEADIKQARLLIDKGQLT